MHSAPIRRTPPVVSASRGEGSGWAAGVGGEDGLGEGAFDAGGVLGLFVRVGEEADRAGEDEEAAGQWGCEAELGVDGGGGAVDVHRDRSEGGLQGEGALQIGA